MRWSWKIAEVSGISVVIHATFLLIIGFVLVSHWVQGATLAMMVQGVLFVLALFACVLLHEFGHALAARRFGIRTRDITLYPIGGVARLERMPDKPIQELWVALAGPAVNVVIAALLFIGLVVGNALEPLDSLTVTGGSFVERLMVVNVFLVLFNMVPAFPMDGGRVVRALLATRMEYTRATQIAATLGQGFALLFGFLGFFYNPFLLFIAFFVWIGAAQEASMTQMRSALSGIPVSRAMVTQFRTLAPDDTLDAAVRQVLAGAQQDFPVLERGEVKGILTRSDLFAALARGGTTYPVSGVMRQDFRTVDAADMLDTAFRGLQECGCHTFPVVHRGELVGLLTMDNVGEFLAIQAALQRSAAPTIPLLAGQQS